MTLDASTDRMHSSTRSASRKVELVAYEEAYEPAFEELGPGRRIPATTALEELTGWKPTRTFDETIDDVIAYKRMSLDLATASA
jgi:nucleoside-diphosphate-sugar epimerase